MRSLRIRSLPTAVGNPEGSTGGEGGETTWVVGDGVFPVGFSSTESTGAQFTFTITTAAPMRRQTLFRRIIRGVLNVNRARKRWCRIFSSRSLGYKRLRCTREPGGDPLQAGDHGYQGKQAMPLLGRHVTEAAGK